MSVEEKRKIFEFLKLVGKLKHMKRTGWVLTDVREPETIAGHMYRMAMLTFLFDGKDGLDTTRCMKLALVHDLAECIVGDITPKCGILSHDKHRMEMEAMDKICSLVGTAGEEILTLFKEYEAQETIEAKTVKDLDVFDMILQAFEYEKEEGKPERLQEFFDSTKNRGYTSPLVASLVSELHKQRGLYSSQKQNVPVLCNVKKDAPQLPVGSQPEGVPVAQVPVFVTDEDLPEFMLTIDV